MHPAPQSIILDEAGTANPVRRAGLLSSAARAGVLLVIGAYRTILRPHLAGSCRFHPTCSQYACDCVTRFGVRRGGWLTLKRLFRCRPFGPRGYDPAPSR